MTRIEPFNYQVLARDNMGMFSLPTIEDRDLSIWRLPLVIGSSSMLIMRLLFNRTAKSKSGFSRVSNVKFVLRQATCNSRATRRRLRGYPRVQLNVQLCLEANHSMHECSKQLVPLELLNGKHPVPQPT